jgi:hypothetical protein
MGYLELLGKLFRGNESDSPPPTYAGQPYRAMTHFGEAGRFPLLAFYVPLEATVPLGRKLPSRLRTQAL